MSALPKEKELSWSELLNIADKERKLCKRYANYDHYYYSYIDFDGNVIRRNGSCYGAATLNFNQDTKNHAIFVDAPYENRLAYNQKNYSDFSEEELYQYLYWWANESFIAPCFINKDPVDIWENGAMFDCQYSGAMIISACMGIRDVRFTGRVKDWHFFRKFIGDDAAAMAIHVFLQHKTFDKVIGYIPSSNGSNWFMFDAYKTHYKYITNKKITDKPLPPLRDKASYGPLSSIFDCDSYGDIVSIKNYPMPKGVQFTIKNSFGQIYKIVDNFYPIESMEQTLKEYVAIHAAL